MKSFICAFSGVLTLLSCAGTYKIEGSSDSSQLDGRMVHLKVIKDQVLKSIDSCDVVHGEFHFNGTIDTAKMANLCVGNDILMPLVLENGDISIKLSSTQQNVTGTPLNDELSGFLSHYNQIINQKAELIHKHDQAIMDGSDMDAIIRQLNEESYMLDLQEDSLITNFVTDHFDNVLGPGVFFLLTIGMQYPELTPWIEDIMSKATPYFKNDPYVKEFYDKARENQRIMNGLQEMPAQQAPTPQSNVPVSPVPTPNQLATPQK